jgi:hypothetical protein
MRTAPSVTWSVSGAGCAGPDCGTIDSTPTETLFPDFADGGGFTTQFILFGSPGQPLAGSVRFYTL